MTEEELIAIADSHRSLIFGIRTNTVPGIIERGEALLKLKKAVGHGRYERALRHLGIGKRVAEKFAAVAKHPRVRLDADRLPGHYSILYELTRLDNDQYEAALANECIGHGTSRNAATAVKRGGIPAPQREIALQREEAQRIGGRTNVRCRFGVADIVSAAEVVEVKDAAEWPKGLGQVLVYVEDFPNRKPRLLLFNCASLDRNVVQHRCRKHGVSVTFAD